MCSNGGRKGEALEASAISYINHLRSVGLSYHFIIARDGRDSARTRDADASTPIIFQCEEPAHRAAHVRSTIPRLRVMGASTNVRSASAWRISRAAASATRRGRLQHLISCSRTSGARSRRSCTLPTTPSCSLESRGFSEHRRGGAGGHPRLHALPSDRATDPCSSPALSLRSHIICGINAGLPRQAARAALTRSPPVAHIAGSAAEVLGFGGASP